MPSEPTSKQERDTRRAEKVAALQKQQAQQRRRRTIGIVVAAVAAVAVVAVILGFVVSGAGKPTASTTSSAIRGLKLYPKLPQTHVDGTTVDYQKLYGMDPPAGGEHWSVWLNCGVYNQPQRNENAVHDLEHGALWITYDPAKLSAADVSTLVAKLPSTYVTVSPYPGLPTPVVASAWGAQVQLSGVSDARLAQFVTKYWRSASSPEPTAPCTGGLDGPGKVG
ncbi:DUF3105 domain-containing protein [Galbitalea soli]|uniref:DUF3105 domain-containing protein n=1 Tax=Galbitalea soli TaxID=1268042 RepID=A0A7C9TSQ2_9MICO|nr:DUF3105 domain-containing protein [Galbitalea soli]NEM92120.1 DUF3105 domain-containing protein [Galbitalea soli]NYJ31928.1 hypothetical protein [Galbitalea soli]